MSKTQIIDIVRKFCAERRKGAGHQKYICAAGGNSIPAPLKDFDKWYTGPGLYVVSTWPPFHYHDSPWGKYGITLP